MVQDTNPARQRYGPYLCVSLLDMSPNTTLYYALHEETGRSYALRLLTITSAHADSILAECLEQLADFATIDTPHIVPIEDYGSEQSTLYIATRILRGGSLDARLKRLHEEGEEKRPLPSLGQVATFLEQIAPALDNIHQRGMVHGQVEPRTIHFDERGAAYLTEVGLTRLTKIIYGLESTNSFNMTGYSAPELWDGQRPEPVSDQYSLACVAYELVTGQPPFITDTVYDMMLKHTNDVALPPHYVRKSVPGTLALPFWQALAKPTHKRHETVGAFVHDFREAIQGYEGAATDFFTFELK